MQRSLNEKQGSRMLDDNINDENTLNNDSSPELLSPEDDLKLLEKLFKKVQSSHKIDKVKLLK